MMRPVYFRVTASGTSQPIPLDRYVNGYAIGATITSAMKVNYTVQYSMDDPEGNNGVKYTTSYNVSGAWFNMDDPVMVNQSANRTSNFAFPPRAVRVVATTFSAGTGATPPVLTLSILPMGMDGN